MKTMIIESNPFPRRIHGSNSPRIRIAARAGRKEGIRCVPICGCMRCNTLSVDRSRYYSFVHMWDRHWKETLPKTLTLADEETRSSICSHCFARVALSRITVTLLLAHGQKPFRKTREKEEERMESGWDPSITRVKMCIEMFVATFSLLPFFSTTWFRKERKRKEEDFFILYISNGMYLRYFISFLSGEIYLNNFIDGKINFLFRLDFRFVPRDVKYFLSMERNSFYVRIELLRVK